MNTLARMLGRCPKDAAEKGHAVTERVRVCDISRHWPRMLHRCHLPPGASRSLGQTESFVSMCDITVTFLHRDLIAAALDSTVNTIQQLCPLIMPQGQPIRGQTLGTSPVITDEHPVTLTAEAMSTARLFCPLPRGPPVSSVR